MTLVQDTTAAFEALTHRACHSGAAAAAVIDAGDIVLRDDLAALCNADQCDHYGQAPSCPPYVGGPEDFKTRFGDFSRAIVIRIDVPTEILLSSQRREVMRLLHEIAAGVERAAAALGWPDAAALAGGSCRHLFCFDHADCAVVGGVGGCRYPDAARPSMSGFGIDVTRLMETAGWKMNRASDRDAATAPVVALVMLG
ncbi:MAG: DUF2284 domain-containing protein [Pseudomonadota bacterium]